MARGIERRDIFHDDIDRGAFDRRHPRCGHLFQHRFKSILVEEKR
jgi:hypothetical protein